MPYAILSEIKAEIGITSAEHDAILQRCLNGAEEKINRLCRRPDGFLADASATARYYVGSGKPFQRIDECVEVTAVGVKDSASDDENAYTAWTVGVVGTTTSADVFPARGDPAYPDYVTPAQIRRPYTLLVIGANGDHDVFTGGEWTHHRGFPPLSMVRRGVPTVEVTAYWGYASVVPDDIKEATIMVAARFYKELQSSMADTLASAELGMELYKKKLHPDVAGILIDGGYVRPAVGRR